MSKLLNNKPLILNTLMGVAVLFIVFISYSKPATSSYSRLKACCAKMKQDAGELPWENISRHFVSSILFR